ncbi:MAG: IS21-like element helper ATPase IstB [Gemmatimonadota bacterium]
MNELQERALELKLHGLLAHWDDVEDQDWLPRLLDWEETERARRGLERRLRRARLGTFKPLADFDWSWPKSIDRQQIDDLFRLEWLARAQNIVLVGPNGIGKTLLAKNLAQQAVLRGATVRFLTASELLNTLAEQDTSISLQRKLRLFAQPQLLCIDELGYLSYDSRHADLLFEIISRRYEQKSILLTTNKPFAEWGEVFPNATTVVTIVDRLVHRCELVSIEGSSYRLKESKEEARRRATKRKAQKPRRSAKSP